MYLEQKIRINSPLVDPDLKQIWDEICVVFGDSSLLINISLFYSQQYVYKDDLAIHIVAASIAGAAPPSMTRHLSVNTGLSGDVLKIRLKNQIYMFVTGVANFFINSPTISGLIAELRSKNLYISVDRVNDDDTLPYIEVSISRG